MEAVDTSNLAATRGKIGLKLQKNHPPRIVTVWFLWQFPEKLHSGDLYVCDLTQSSICSNKPVSSPFVENNQQQLFSIAAACQETGQKLKKESWGNQMPVGRFEKLQPTARDLEDHAHVQGPLMPWSLPLADLEAFHTGRGGWGSVVTCLPRWGRGAPPRTEPSATTGRHQLKDIRKSLSHHYWSPN